MTYLRNTCEVVRHLKVANPLFRNREVVDVSKGALLTITTEDLLFSSTEPDPEIPEPATLSLFGLGLAGRGYMRRRRAA